MSEQDKENKPKQSRKAKPKVKQAWARNFYIKGYGHVVKGEEATKTQLDAWKAITDIKPKLEDVTDIPTESS